MRSFLILSLSFFFTLAAAEKLSSDDLTLENISILNNGEVVLIEREKKAMKGRTHTAYILIPAKVQDVYEVLINFSNYPQFMPNLDKISVELQNKKQAKLAYYLSLPGGIKKRYKLILNYQINEISAKIAWQKLPWPEIDISDSIVATEGYWELTPYHHQILAKYHVYTDPGNVPFGLGWIVDYLSNKSIVDVLKNTRQRVVHSLNKPRGPN